MFDRIFQALFSYSPFVFSQGEFRFDLTLGSLIAALLVGAVAAAAVMTYKRVRVNEGRLRDRIQHRQHLTRALVGCRRTQPLSDALERDAEAFFRHGLQ